MPARPKYDVDRIACRDGRLWADVRPTDTFVTADAAAAAVVMPALEALAQSLSGNRLPP